MKGAACHSRVSGVSIAHTRTMVVTTLNFLNFAQAVRPLDETATSLNFLNLAGADA